MIENQRKSIEDQLVLNLMAQIEEYPSISQRALSSSLGIAIGLVNSYLRRCVQKGWIKIKQVPAKRFAYYITPKGFVEKTKLSVNYLSSSFKLFKDAKLEFQDLFETCRQRGWKKVCLVGTGELAEIAMLVLRFFDELEMHNIEVNKLRQTFMNSDQVYVITDMQTPQDTYESLINQVSHEKILYPAMLHINRSLDTEREAL